MARIRRPTQGDASCCNIPQFALGIIFGAIVMFNFQGTNDQGGLSSSSSSSSSSLRSLEKQSPLTIPKEALDNGWKSINVFYGETSGLGVQPDQEWFAQVNQDKLLLELIGPNGYFIDLAANDAKELSNTLALENHGWNGLCVEPNPTYWYGLSHRKCTVVGALVGGSKEQVDVQFRGVFGGIVGKLDNKLANRKNEPQAPKEKRYTAPLKDVFTKFQVPKVIDYLSLDVEGAEFLIMKNFPFGEYQFKILTVERPGKDLKELLESQGYRFLKDLAWWGETLWAHESTGYTPEHPKIAKIQTEERN
jgi:hypothetical protein